MQKDEIYFRVHIRKCQINVEEDQEEKDDVDGKCIGGKLTSSVLIKSAYGLANEG